MAYDQHIGAHEALTRLCLALETTGKGGSTDEIEAFLREGIDDLSDAEAELMQHRFDSMTLAVELLGPCATLDEIADLAERCERGTY